MIGTKEAFRNQGIHIGSISYEDSKNREQGSQLNLSPTAPDQKTNLKKGTRVSLGR